MISIFSHQISGTLGIWKNFLANPLYINIAIKRTVTRDRICVCSVRKEKQSCERTWFWCPSRHSFIYFCNFLSTVLIQYSSLVTGWHACCCAGMLLLWEKSAPKLFCSWIFLGWTKGGVPGGIRTRDCRTAARRANHIATPHPKPHSHAAPTHLWNIQYSSNNLNCCLYEKKQARLLNSKTRCSFNIDARKTPQNFVTHSFLCL